MDERPRSLILALRLMAGLIVVAGITVVLMILLREELLRSWAEGNADVRDLLHTEGLDAVLEGTVRPPQIVPVAIVMWVVMTALLWLLGVFVSNGFEWARIGITLLLGFTAVAAVGSTMLDPPALFIGCTVVCIVLGVLSLVFMWAPATTRYIHPAPSRPEVSS